MNCKQSINFMHDYLDGQLSGENERKLSVHLEACQNCQKHFHELIRTITLVQSSPKMEAPKDFTAKVMQQLPEERKHMRYRRWFSKHPYILAAAVLFMFFIGSLFTGWSQNNELVVSKQENLIIEGDTVIVPENITVTGDLFIKNGNLKVKGQIEGDVTLVNGELLSDRDLTASIDNISGELKQIDRAIQWALYEMSNFFKDLFRVDG